MSRALFFRSLVNVFTCSTYRSAAPGSTGTLADVSLAQAEHVPSSVRASLIGFAIAHEIGHLLGLEHTRGLMSPHFNPRWVDGFGRHYDPRRWQFSEDDVRLLSHIQPEGGVQ